MTRTKLLPPPRDDKQAPPIPPATETTIQTTRRRSPLRLEILESREAPAADLVVENVEPLKFHPEVLPGDLGIVYFQVRNVGDTAVSGGKTGIHVYMAHEGGIGNGFALIGKVRNVSVNIPAGKVASFAAVVTIPRVDLSHPSLPAGNYKLWAEVDPNNNISESNNSNNIGESAETIQHVFKFGKLTKRQGVLKGTYEGAKFNFLMGGAGVGELAFTPAGGTQDDFIDMTFTGTDAKSKAAVIGVSETALRIRNISAPGGLSRLFMPGVDAAGSLSFGGGLGSLHVHDLGGGAGANLTIGNGPPTRIQAGIISDIDITANAGLLSFTAGTWVDLDADRDVLTAPFVNRLVFGGDFEADITLDGPGPRSTVLGFARIDGTVRESRWKMMESGTGIGKVLVGEGDNWQFFTNKLVRLFRVYGDFKNTIDSVAIIADRFVHLQIGGNVDAQTIQAQSKSEQSGIAINNLFFGTVSRLNTLLATKGGIVSLRADDWEFNTALTTKWIGTLTASGKNGTNGNFKASLRLTAGRGGHPVLGPTSLGSVSVAGEVGGTWEIFANITKLSADRSSRNVFSIVGGVGTDSPGTRIDSIDFSGELSAYIKASRIWTIRANDIISAEIESKEGIFSILTGWLKSTDVTITEGNIFKMVVKRWEHGNVTAKKISYITVKGDPDTRFAAPLWDVNITLTGPSEESINVRGGIEQFNIRHNDSTSGISLLQAEYWHTGSVNGGFVRELMLFDGNLDSVFFDLTGTDWLRGNSLGNVSVAGLILNSTFLMATGANSITMTAVTNSAFTTPGNIGYFAVKGFEGSVIPAFSRTRVEAEGIREVFLRDVDKIDSNPSWIKANTVKGYVRYEGNTIAAQLSNQTAPTDPADQAGNFKLIIT